MRGGSRHNRSTQRAAGFTLLEILLVVTLIALAGGLGGGLYAGTYKKLTVEKTARQFTLMAKYARISAIERGQPYELQLGATGFLVATAKWNS